MNIINTNSIDAVVIGASAGGLAILERLLSFFQADLAVPVFIVQHMAADMDESFVSRLDENS